ncbi:hypothetical protein [Nocardiopsis rhodophaea]|uniref:hypothetical protein n=1 Tax=Nocardiopsis rhodophaea TaxID=280238 RepID=UPI0031D25C61
MLVHLRVRRFFCDDPGCAKRTFAEQVPGLTQPHAQRTNLLSRLRTCVGMALGGRGGARLARHLAVAFSRITLLRLIRAATDPTITDAQVEASDTLVHVLAAVGRTSSCRVPRTRCGKTRSWARPATVEVASSEKAEGLC